MHVTSLALGFIGLVGEIYGVHEGVMFRAFIALFALCFFRHDACLESHALGEGL